MMPIRTVFCAITQIYSHSADIGCSKTITWQKYGVQNTLQHIIIKILHFSHDNYRRGQNPEGPNRWQIDFRDINGFPKLGSQNPY